MAAAFVHRTSRAGDPQLHTHVLVANVAEGIDGAWSAPDARLLYPHARTAGFLYQAALRAGLSRRPRGPLRAGPPAAWPSSTASPRHCCVPSPPAGARSSTTWQRPGRTSARAAEVAALVTRSAKELGRRRRAGRRACAQRWLAQAGRARPDAAGDLATAPSTTSWAMSAGAAERRRDRRLVAHLAGPEGLTAASSTFERRDVVRAVAEALPDGAPVAEVEALADRVLDRPDVVALPSVGRGGELRHTTLELLAVERSLLDTAGAALRDERRGRGRARRRCARPSAVSRCSPTNRCAMVERLTTSGAGVDVVVGKAGAGKTLALAAARQAWEGERLPGPRHRALGPGRPRDCADGAGIESRHLGQAARRHRTSGPAHARLDDVVVLDEAGMVGTRDLARLLEAADDRPGPRWSWSAIPASCPRSRPAARWPRCRPGRGRRAHREPAPARVLGARRPRRAAPRAGRRGPRHLRARRPGPRRADHGRGPSRLVERWAESPSRTARTR